MTGLQALRLMGVVYDRIQTYHSNLEELADISPMMPDEIRKASSRLAGCLQEYQLLLPDVAAALIEHGESRDRIAAEGGDQEE